MNSEASNSNPDDGTTGEVHSLSEAIARLNMLRAKPASPPDKPDFRFAEIEYLLSEVLRTGFATPTEVTDFLIAYVLPVATSDSTESSSQEMHLHRLRELVRDWLEQLPEQQLPTPRNTVIKWCLDDLKHAPRRGLLHQLSIIGYRAKDVVDSLRQIASREDDIGDLALRAFGGLEPTDEDDYWFRKEIAVRIIRRRNEDTAKAAAAAGMVELIDAIVGTLDKSFESWMSLSRIRWIAAYRPGDLREQERIWAAVSRLVSLHADAPMLLVFIGGVVEDCHCAPAALEFVAALPKIAQLGQIHVYRWLNRYIEFVSPVQIQALGTAECRSNLDVLQPLTARNSGQVGLSSSTDSEIKLKAVVVMLASGDERVREWAEEALRSETNNFVLNRLLEILSVAPFSKLPTRVFEILNTARTTTRNTDYSEILPFLSAAELAGSSLDREVFETLLNSNVTNEGHPFTRPIEAAARLGVWLSEQDRHTLEFVRASAKNPPSTMALTVASEILRMVARRGWLTRNDVELLCSIALNKNFAWYIRRSALLGIGASAGLLGTEEAVSLLGSLISLAEPRLATAAVISLINLKKQESFAREIEAFALADFRETGAERKAALNIGVEQAEIIGSMCVTDPARYAHVLAAIVRHSDAMQVHGALQRYVSAIGKNQQPIEPVMEAILARIAEGETRQSSSLYLFDILSHVSPQTFFDNKWPNAWDHWMADAREGIAKLIPSALERTGETYRQIALDWLKLLLQDSVFAVRRSAARSYAKLDSSGLRTMCRQWLGTASIAWKMRAAEAACWLPIEDPNTFENEFLHRLRRDEERCVRERADHCRNELMRRTWARSHLESISVRRNDPWQWILEGYGAGRALSRVGDDETILEVEQLSRDTTYPPNVSRWFSQIAKALRDKWRETTEKWPEPWVPLRGFIEEFDGDLVVGDVSYPAHFTLWREPPATDTDRWDWGGGAAPTKTPYMRLLFEFMSGDKKILIRAPDRVEASAICSGGSSGSIRLTGSGTYPSKPGGDPIV